MLETHRKGYAVMDPELKGYSFTSEDFERCKHFCHNGDVIVEVSPKKIGFNLNVYWSKWYKPFEFSRRFSECNILKLHIKWAPMWGHKFGNKVLYESRKIDGNDNQ